MSVAVMTMMSSITALAAGSPTPDTVQAPVATQTAITYVSETADPDTYVNITKTSDGYKVEVVSKTTADAAKVAVQNLILRDVAALGAFLGDANLQAAATTQGATVTAEILATVDIDRTTAVPDSDGMYTIVVSNPYVKAGDNLVILHYNGTTWELIRGICLTDGVITFRMANFSPISIVRVSGSSPAQSPRTGASSSVLWILALASLTGAAFAFRKFRRA